MEKLSEKLFSSSYGDYNDAQILNDENMKNQFILEKKKEYSFAFNVPEKNIIISNLRSGSINYTLGLKNEEITEYHFSKIKQDKNILEIKINCLKFLMRCLMKEEIEIQVGE